MFNPDEMTVIHTAAQCATTAASAAADQQKKAVAYQINSAANCGETSCEFLQPLLPEVKSALTTKGYKLRQSGIANPDSSVVITWERPV